MQFPRYPKSLDQYYRQQTPNTGPTDTAAITGTVAELFDKIGPGVLVTHSASGILGWITGIKNRKVRAIVTYEPTAFVFAAGEVPPAPTLFDGSPLPGGTVEVSLADFRKLTRIPIQVIYGDNIPTSPSPIGGPDRWRARLVLAQQFVDAINEHGGDAELPAPAGDLRARHHSPPLLGLEQPRDRGSAVPVSPGERAGQARRTRQGGRRYALTGAACGSHKQEVLDLPGAQAQNGLPPEAPV